MLIDSIKRLLYFGFGAAALSADKLRELIDELVKRGELTTEEGKKIYEELVSRGEQERRNLNTQIRNQVLEILKEVGVADQAKVAALESKVEELERKLEDLSAKISGITSRETPEG